VLERKIHGQPPAWIRRGTVPGTWEIDEDAARPFRRMIELRESGRGWLHIARTLNEEKFISPRGRRWVVGNVTRYLSEPYLRKMLGDVPYSFGGDGGGRRVGTDVIWTIGIFPPLLTEERAERLREVARQLRNPDAIARGMAADTTYICKGRLHCAVCGARMASHSLSAMKSRSWPSATDAQLRQYRCYQRNVNPEGHKAASSVVAASQVEEAVARVLRVALALPAAAPPKRKKTVPKPSGRTAAEIDVEMDRLLSLYVANKLSQPDYERFALRLSQERETLAAAERSARTPPAFEAATTAFGSLADAAGDPEALQHIFRRIILNAIERIDAPTTLPAGAVPLEVTQGFTDTERRKYIRVQLRWDTNHGSVFYAGLYRTNWSHEQPIYWVQEGP
jgi:hypothetical protein